MLFLLGLAIFLHPRCFCLAYYIHTNVGTFYILVVSHDCIITYMYLNLAVSELKFSVCSTTKQIH